MTNTMKTAKKKMRINAVINMMTNMRINVIKNVMKSMMIKSQVTMTDHVVVIKKITNI